MVIDLAFRSPEPEPEPVPERASELLPRAAAWQWPTRFAHQRPLTNARGRSAAASCRTAIDHAFRSLGAG